MLSHSRLVTEFTPLLPVSLPVSLYKNSVLNDHLLLTRLSAIEALVKSLEDSPISFFQVLRRLDKAPLTKDH